MGLGVTGTITDTTTIPPSGNWPQPVADGATAVDDLFHAAVNGRGKYLKASDPQEYQGAIEATLIGALAGAWLATQVPSRPFRLVLPALLTLVWLYTLWRKDLGHAHLPLWSARREAWLATAMGASIGFYDGLFGPGTGSFFVFALVRGLGWDFLHASAAAKRLNLAANAAALAWFIPNGHVVWALALPMAVANVLGSTIGTRLALKRGVGFVRSVFLVVVGALIVKTAWDAWHL